jgi:hypothetical protein
MEVGRRLTCYAKIKIVKMLRYIELKTGFEDNGPAWIGFVTRSKSGRTIYFNGQAFQRSPGLCGGNHADIETGEEYWISGVKKNGEDRHWAGSGKVLVEAAAVSAYLEAIGAKSLDTSRCEVTMAIAPTDIERLHQLENQTAGERYARLKERLGLP